MTQTIISKKIQKKKQQDKIYVRANGKNLEREARLELTDSDGAGCSFDAQVEWGNTLIDGFHVDTCDDQIVSCFDFKTRMRVNFAEK